MPFRHTVIVTTFLCLWCSRTNAAFAAAVDNSGWVVLNTCRLIASPWNDGDSFRVRWGGRDLSFRLYFVDCPETDARFPQRIAEQAAYFGIEARDALVTGFAASRFARSVLSQKFTVRTQWADALGSGHDRRFYATVQVGGRDLAEMLVVRGYARIHGVTPMGESGLTLESLERKESSARMARLGAWGYSSLQRHER